LTDRDGLAGALLDLQELTERLRRDCPWDRAQTARTIVPHTVEEAYEVADAALAGDGGKLVDELGDLLFQTFFLSLLLEEDGQASLEAVAREIHDKLVRRHPHVFGESGELGSPGAVKHRWEQLKVEQEGRPGVFHDVPATLPALLHAQKVQRRAATVGFEYESVVDALTDLDDELRELREELQGSPDPTPETEPDARAQAELGDVLFACVNVSRQVNVDPELALRQATQRFVARIERAEALAVRDGQNWARLDLEGQDRYFDRAKEEEGPE
jgi:MazG family protein